MFGGRGNTQQSFPFFVVSDSSFFFVFTYLHFWYFVFFWMFLVACVDSLRFSEVIENRGWSAKVPSAGVIEQNSDEWLGTRFAALEVPGKAFCIECILDHIIERVGVGVQR
jgi:hypothetical protein